MGADMTEICTWFFLVLFEKKKINNVLFYINDIATTKSNSKNNVTRPIVLKCSSPYIPLLSVICFYITMRRSTHILLKVCELI